ncbi:hypothetical protein [Humisphaera borealis]|uniref:Uncharacterized protein n=1 Tax=Humisphaera borealis TaxID=2807512 RepID=A0A7M2WTA2_9BACT|nr:hypothetical protein [Humisphaera borealis]QOV88738.1 hypothetical protein IPV69_21285 [Humisphaera borealis]
MHVLSDKDRPDLDCKLTDADLARILGKVNKVWRMAGVQFHVQPIHRESPFEVEKFDKVRAKALGGSLGLYRMIANPTTRDLPGIHVYYVHELPPNGVYIGQNLCFVKETASLRKVEGGIDEPIPRVTSHEIGHALGLPHRQDRTNLLASGTTGTTFNEAEVKIARATALKNKGVMSIAEAEAKSKAGNGSESESLKKLLKSIDPPASATP